VGGPSPGAPRSRNSERDNRDNNRERRGDRDRGDRGDRDRGDRDRENTVCKFYAQTGECRLGLNCPYKHSLSVSASASASSSDRARGRSHSGSGDEPAASRRICKFFERTGTCRSGDDCPFLHSRQAAMRASQQTQAPTGPRNQQTSSTANSAAASAPTGAAKECRYFKRNGTCRDGDACPFVHVSASTTAPTRTSAANTRGAGGRAQSSTAPATSSSAEPKKVCRYFSKNGTCRDGDSCPFSHDVGTKPTRAETRGAAAPAAGDDKTKECRYFRRNGTCRDGDNCPFLHVAAPTTATASTRFSSVRPAPAPAHTQTVTKEDKTITVTTDEDKKFTKFCRFYQKNPADCKLGSDCPFIHAASNTVGGPSGGSGASSSSSSGGAAGGNTSKVTVCKYFKRLGHCRLGANCVFAHTLTDASSAAPVASNANSRSTNTAEGESKPRVCRYFKRNGSCQLGSECPFVHEQQAKAATKTASTSTPNAATSASSAGNDKDTSDRVCRYFKRNGTCKLGDECPFAHTAAGPSNKNATASAGAATDAGEVASTRLCRYFKRNGTCNLGSACPFVHAQSASAVSGNSSPSNTLRRARVGASGATGHRARPRTRQELAGVLNVHAVSYSAPNSNSNSNAHDNGHNSPSTNRIHTDPSVGRPFLENILRNNSHKPGFILEAYLAVVESDRVRILDEYRMPLCVSAVNMLQTTSHADTQRQAYISMDKTFVCNFNYDNSELVLSYTHAGNGSTYNGKLPVSAHVSVPVDDLVATVCLLHDFLFGFVLNAYSNNNNNKDA
jgi:hypothetical protein